MARLSLEQAEQVANWKPGSIFEGAALHMTQGWAIFPLAPRSKEPYEGTNGVKQATRDSEQYERWVNDVPDANIGGATDGFLVIDVDVRSGAKRPLELQTRWHASGRGDGGGHLIYRLTPAQRHMGLKSGSGRLGPGMDIKTGAGSYVVLPDSLHPDTGQPYVSDRMPIKYLPDDLARKILDAQNSKRGGEGETNKGRSILSHLLSHPPVEGGRNEWLTKVAGHFAKQYRKQPDLYYEMMRMANERLIEPLDEMEVDKTANSIWNTEAGGHPDREFSELLTQDNGYLTGGDFETLHGILDGPKEATMIISEQWGNFDVKLRAKLIDPESDAMWFDLILQCKHDRKEISTLVPASIFGDTPKLRGWLASFGLSVKETPERPLHKSMGWSARLGRYVGAQSAPVHILAKKLGWDDEEGAYLTHLNAVSEDGARVYRKSQPVPSLKSSGQCNFEYGFAGSREQAQRVLAEVMTFHDENCMAAFGAWWAASLVKQWLQPLAGLFPFMAIEAASESGKTEGAFGMLVRLAGTMDSAGFYTVAALRDVLSTNSNGIVWIDDVDEPTRYFELLRSLTMGGVLSKKAGENFANTQQFRLVGSLLMSGEALGLEKQKALLDRAVLISPPSPTDRISLKSGRESIAQYQDILDLRADLEILGGEQAIAGHYLWMVAGWREQIEQTFRDTRTLPGRVKARDALLRTGARVLDAMLATGQRDTKAAWSGDGRWAKQLEEYLALAEPTTFKGDNKLFLELLPWALRNFNLPETAHRAGGGAAAFVEGIEEGAPVIWFSPRQLAKLWGETNHGRVDARLDTEDAIKNQAKQAGFWGVKGAMRREFRVSVRSEGARAYYYGITGAVAEILMERSRN
jgi:hypothetical protein